MKKMVLASACILALASPAAFAQKAQPGDGASSQGNVGPGASQEPPAARSLPPRHLMETARAALVESGRPRQRVPKRSAGSGSLIGAPHRRPHSDQQIHKFVPLIETAQEISR